MTGAPDVAVLEHLSVRDVRCLHEVDLAVDPRVTLVTGANGEGKTSLLEAIAYLSLGRSFRGAPDKALVRNGADAAFIRASVRLGERLQTIEVEIRAQGTNTILLNKQRINRRGQLAQTLPVVTFSPDDLDLVKGPPAGRRDFLDDILGVLAPRYDVARSDFERVLRHRNALLRSNGPADPTTLGIFDEQLVRAGGELLRGRLRLIDRLMPYVRATYQALAGEETPIDSAYVSEISTGALEVTDADAVEPLLQAALETARPRERDRRITLVGPHRDDWALRIDGLASRDQASQGEQRTLAFALRLAGHRLVTELRGMAPVLLLDDVFSELDDDRSRLLVEALPEGQTMLTTAGTLPAGVHGSSHYEMRAGRLSERTPA